MKRLIFFSFLVIFLSCNKSVSKTDERRENEIRDSIILCLEKKMCDSLVLLADKQMMTYSLENDIKYLDIAKDYCNKALGFAEKDTISSKNIKNKISHINKLVNVHLELEEKKEIKKKEKCNPIAFLKIYNVNSKHELKLVKKNKMYISGEICNAASYMGYRNIKCQVLFYSSKDKLIKTSEFFIDKTLCQGDCYSFNAIVEEPKFFTSWNVCVVDAYTIDFD